MEVPRSDKNNISFIFPRQEWNSHLLMMYGPSTIENLKYTECLLIIYWNKILEYIKK